MIHLRVYDNVQISLLVVLSNEKTARSQQEKGNRELSSESYPVWVEEGR